MPKYAIWYLYRPLPPLGFRRPDIFAGLILGRRAVARNPNRCIARIFGFRRRPFSIAVEIPRVSSIPCA